MKNILDKYRYLSKPIKQVFVLKPTLWLIFVFSFGPLLNAKLYPQGPKITISNRNTTFEEVLAVIEKQTDYLFVYDKSEVDPNRKITVNEKNKTVEEVISSLLQNTNIVYAIEGNNIMLMKENKENVTSRPSRQNVRKKLTGEVTDQNGEPLIGVNILEKGTSNGRISDINGKFTLDIAGNNSVLVFSYIGYITKEVRVGNLSALQVIMDENTQEIEEVVVVGYGTVKKSDLTGSVSQITTDNFNKGVNSSIDQAIMGKSAGVQIRQTTAEPGGGTSIRIRGATSITGGNDPLYVIDGLPIDNRATISAGDGALLAYNPNIKNPLSLLNPNDIESIEILKDASATAIYGSRGANGVILVTTKKGLKGRTSIEFSSNIGVQQVMKKYDVLGAQEYMSVLNRLSVETGGNPIFTPEFMGATGNGTNWQDEVLQTANVQDYNISFRGGNEQMNYYVSGNYFNQRGVVKNSGMEKYNLKINLEARLNSRLSFDVNLNTGVVNDDAAVTGSTYNEKGGIIYSSVFYDPTIPVRDKNGDYSTSNDLLLPNPVTVYKGIMNKIQTDRTFGSITFNYKIAEGLTTALNLGTDRQTVRKDTYNSKITFTGKSANGAAYINTLLRSNMLAEYTLSYMKKFKKIHTISAMGGATYQKFSDRGQVSGVNDFPTDVLSTDNLGFGNKDEAYVGSHKVENALLSFLGRVNYNLMDKYLLTTTIRADGSSRFGKNNRFGYFPSFAFAWKLQEEEFIKDLFSEMKFRAGWGLTGNQEIGNYNSLATYNSIGSAVFNGAQSTATGPSRLPNPDLKWETTEQYNIGVDVGIFQGRITGSLDFFIKNTRDMLINLPQPLSGGYNTKLMNVGKMRNRGFEAVINSWNISTRDFKWTTGLNFSAIKNKVLDIGGLDRIIMGWVPEAQADGTIIQAGLPLNSYYGFKITGIFQTDEQIANSVQPNSKPGYPIFLNAEDDGEINNDDRVVLGNPFPDFTFGFNNTFRYKDWGLSININGQYGSELLNATTIGFMYPTNFRRNRSARQINDRWTPENPSAKWPSGTNPTAYGGGKINSLAVEDASYLKLQAVQLSYTVPVNKINYISSVRLSLTGENLFILTNYKGMNPDANLYGRSNFQYDFMSYPLARTWSFGVNISF